MVPAEFRTEEELALLSTINVELIKLEQSEFIPGTQVAVVDRSLYDKLEEEV